MLGPILLIHSLWSLTLTCSSSMHVIYLQRKWTLVSDVWKNQICQLPNLQPWSTKGLTQPNACVFIPHSVSSILISVSLLCSLSYFHLSASPHPLSFSLSLTLSPFSHYESLVSWTVLFFSTVLILIRVLPPECGPACIGSMGTEICSHFSSCSWWDFLQNIQKVLSKEAHCHLLTFN